MLVVLFGTLIVPLIAGHLQSHGPSTEPEAVAAVEAMQRDLNAVGSLNGVAAVNELRAECSRDGSGVLPPEAGATWAVASAELSAQQAMVDQVDGALGARGWRRVSDTDQAGGPRSRRYAKVIGRWEHVIVIDVDEHGLRASGSSPMTACS